MVFVNLSSIVGQYNVSVSLSVNLPLIVFNLVLPTSFFYGTALQSPLADLI